MMSEIVRIAKELSDEELIIHMTELNRMSKGIIPENLYILTNEMIQRFEKMCKSLPRDVTQYGHIVEPG